MTDNEIIKALEFCISDDYTCVECPYADTKHMIGDEYELMPNGKTYDEFSCDEWLKLDLFDLINRQKADIKKLTSGKCVYLSDDETTEYCVEGPCPNYKTEAQIKVEAYKEFAKKVNDEISEAVYSNHRAITERINEHNANRYEDKICSMWDDQITALVSIRFYIDNLVKEMVGVNNA